MRIGMTAALAIACAIASAACRAGTDYPDRVGGGGGGGGGGGPDAGVTGDGAVDAPAGLLTGTVCVVTDLRLPTTCAAGDQSGIVVTDRDSAVTTTTAADGSFRLDLGTTATAQLEIGAGDGTLVPSIVPVPVDGAPVIAPVPRRAELADLEDALGVAIPDGSGAIALYVLDPAGAGVAGFVVQPPSGTLYPPIYDDDTAATGWDSGGATGAAGAALVFGVGLGTTEMSASADGGVTNLSLNGIPVVNGRVTFLTARTQ
jgi:hypothetical protein